MEFSLILHAHLPYVRPIGPEILEERWLYEAVAETYLPLLQALERLQADDIPARVAISISGPLLSMLSDQELMGRCRAHLLHTLGLAERQCTAYADDPRGPAAQFHRQRLVDLVADLDRRQNDLLHGFQSLEQAGRLELFTAAGTHGYLPLLATDAGRRAQIEAGVVEFERHFGHRPRGLWLPECAYSPGLDHLLKSAGIDWFVVESSTVSSAWPSANGASCVSTPAGVAAFARDATSARQVWDSKSGYPSGSAYREFYRDEGFDLPLQDVAPWLVENWVRSDTGLKFFRVSNTDRLDAKEPYQPKEAVALAMEHARHYAGLLRQREGLVVTPFDAELFGHWWFEGPLFLEHLFREIAKTPEITAVTPSDYLLSQPNPSHLRLSSGSWGMSGDHGVWLGPANDAFWPKLHQAELKMVELAADPSAAKPLVNQAARQLLLAQSSDWPFILTGGTTTTYAQRRIETHLDRFWALISGDRNPDLVEANDAIFPSIDGRRLYQQHLPRVNEGPLQILMLSWEFPPGNIGGLGRHVFDLGEALANAGHTIHVITLADDQVGPGTTVESDMTIHRIARPPELGNFLSWVYSFNTSMVDKAKNAAAVYGPFDIVHSHDWLVGQAGLGLKSLWNMKLIATVHATEKGRNRAILEPIQAAIHAEEWQLTAASNGVITVSRAMAAEVTASFRVTPTVIYNGVKIPLPADPPPLSFKAPYFFYIGRLVVEKGVQVAIRALALLDSDTHLVVAGKGPMESELRALAKQLGIESRVHFLGRVSDGERDAWLQHAAGGLVPSLYEPFGITALEVMSSGAPVIVGDTGGLAEIVSHGLDGLKVIPGDENSLAQAMTSLITNPDRAALLASAGKQMVFGRFAWPAIADQTIQVYRQALLPKVSIH